MSQVQCYRCHRVGSRAFQHGEDRFGRPYATCLNRSACDARKMRRLKSMYPGWGQ